MLAGLMAVGSPALVVVPEPGYGRRRGRRWRSLAWSHTVSTAYRFTPFELKLVPGSPTTYLYDGQPRQMTSRRRDRHGQERRRVARRRARARSTPATTARSSRRSSDCRCSPGRPTTAWALGDANAGNFRYLNHFFEINQAQSVGELREIQRAQPGRPVGEHDRRRLERRRLLLRRLGRAARDRREGGRLQHRARARHLRGARPAGARRLAVGMRVGHATPTRSSPASSGPGNLPKLFRGDYVTNSNDSYWLSNPEQPLEGFDRIIGDERTERSLRTRSGLVQVEQRLAGTDGWPGDRFTLQPAPGHGVRRTASTPASCGATSWPTFCEAQPDDDRARAGPVDVSEACPVLRAWDLHDDLDSRRRDPVPALREPRAGRGAGGRHAGPLHDPVRRQRRRPHAVRPEHRQPGRRAVVRRRGQRPARRRHPARRAAARLAVRAPRLASGSRSTAGRAAWACSTRSTSAGPAPARTPATRTCRTARAS